MATTIKIRRFLAARLRTLAARLDPPPATTTASGWITGPFGVVPVDYRTGTVGSPEITYGTHCGGS